MQLPLPAHIAQAGRHALVQQVAADADPGAAAVKALSTNNARQGKLVASPTTAEEWHTQYAPGWVCRMIHPSDSPTGGTPGTPVAKHTIFHNFNVGSIAKSLTDEELVGNRCKKVGNMLRQGFMEGTNVQPTIHTSSHNGYGSLAHTLSVAAEMHCGGPHRSRP